MQSTDAVDWKMDVKNEKLRFEKFNVMTVIPRRQLTKGVKAMIMSWAMKKKSNGTPRGRLNTRGYEQIKGQLYCKYSIVAPVTNANLA